jgi:ATP-dependent protease ClpP protease subunit
MIAYLKGIVRNGGKGSLGIGLEVFRLDADEDIALTEEESESLGEVTEDTAIMRIYEEIGEDFWTGGGISAKKFAKDLSDMGNIKQLNIHINCLGGDVFTAQAMYNIIGDHPANTTSYIDGVAASAATVVASAADEVVARQNSMYMIHNPWAICMGNASDMREAADTLEKLTVPVVGIYKTQVKGRIREAKIRTLMENETWMTADEAQDYGFVDKVKGKIKPLARASTSEMICNGKVFNYAKYHYKNVPEYPIEKEETRMSKETTTTTKPDGPVANWPKDLTKQLVREQFPGVYSEIVSDERDRLAKLEAMRPANCPPDLAQLIDKAKTEGKLPSDIAMEAYNMAQAKLATDTRLGSMHREGSFKVPAGDAPNNKVESKDQKGSKLLIDAFKSNGR